MIELNLNTDLPNLMPKTSVHLSFKIFLAVREKEVPETVLGVLHALTSIPHLLHLNLQSGIQISMDMLSNLKIHKLPHYTPSVGGSWAFLTSFQEANRTASPLLLTGLSQWKMSGWREKRGFTPLAPFAGDATEGHTCGQVLSLYLGPAIPPLQYALWSGVMSSPRVLHCPLQSLYS